VPDSSSDYARQLKPKFDGTLENCDFRFGPITDHDPALGIQRGRIRLSAKEELKPLFDDVVNKILNSCLNSLRQQRAQVI
jgi:hypothetical protein